MSDDFTRDMFSDPAPRDVVPGHGLDREALIALNAAAGTWQRVTIPGDPVEDVDGYLIGMTPSRTETVFVAGACVTTQQIEAVGLSAADLPNLRIIAN